MRGFVLVSGKISRSAARHAMSPSPTYRTIEDTVGNTPLVQLRNLVGKTSNEMLAKLDGNNPACWVKDSPALSMIVEAEKRGDIKRGDTLIEATSGNTGIALAMRSEERRVGKECRSRRSPY